jgi:hypothetical protein
VGMVSEGVDERENAGAGERRNKGAGRSGVNAFVHTHTHTLAPLRYV